MSATPVIPLTADEVITSGRALYKAVQDATWPQDPESIAVLMRASSRLSTEIQVCARVRDDGFAVTPGRIASTRRAASDLLAAVHAYLGPEVAAEYVSNGEQGRAAA